MNKLKILSMITILLLFCSCSNNIINIKENNDNTSDDIEYPTYKIEEYEKMDKYTYESNQSSIKYRSIYYFKDNMCVNAKEEVIFDNDKKANDYYNEIKDEEEYISITINKNIVSYYNNPEYFEYMMYPKDMLIELLNKEEFDE